MLTHEKLFAMKPGDRAGNGRGGYGLTAIAQKNGTVFVQRIKIRDRETNITLGRFPDELDLPEAVMLARDNVQDVRYGRDPRRPKVAKTLEDVAEAFVKLHLRGKTKSTERQWRNSLKGYIYERIGKHKPISMITRSDAMHLLEPEWPRPIAKANKRRLSAILEYAVNHGLRTDNPVAGIKASGMPGGEHEHTRIGWVAPADAPRVLDAIRAATRTRPATRLSTLFVALTACRGAEARQMTFAEVDGDLWTVPLAHTGKRSKKDGPLRIPLSVRAIEILDEAAQHYGRDGLLFPNRSGGELDGNRSNQLMARCGGDGRLHGWRSTFSTWCGFQGVPFEHCEAALGHTLPPVARAYQRGDYLEHRRPLMQRWADFLTGDTE